MAKILSSMCVFAGRLNPKTVDDSVDWRGIERSTVGCMCSTSLVRFLHKIVSANDFVQLFLCFFHHIRMPNELHHCPLYCAWSGICAGPKNVLNFNFSCSWSQSSCHCPHKHTIYNNVYMEAWISTLMIPLEAFLNYECVSYFEATIDTTLEAKLLLLTAPWIIDLTLKLSSSLLSQSLEITNSVTFALPM